MNWTFNNYNNRVITKVKELMKQFNFIILSSLLCISTSSGCSNQQNNLPLQNITNPQIASSQLNKNEIGSAFKIYEKTKDNAKKWSKDAVLINVYSNYLKEWQIYYYSKSNEKIYVYNDDTSKYIEVSLNDPIAVGLLPSFIRAPYKEIVNWKIDSDKAFELAGKESDAALDVFMEYDQKSKKIEWNISSLDSIYVNIETGQVRKESKSR